MKEVKEISKVKNLKGVRVILRASLNVPVKNGKVSDDFRLEKVIETFRWFKKRGAKVIAVSHLGSDGHESLKQVADHVNKTTPVKFVSWTEKNSDVSAIERMKDGDVVILENLRKNEGEMKNAPSFAKALAKLGDIYVNDDFTVAHRKHASVVAITKFVPSYIGPVFATEIKELSKVLKPKKPFVVIFGGAKFETKLPLVKKFLPIAEKIFIVGALANSFFKELGYEVGQSLVDKKNLGLKKLSQNKKIVLPLDVVVKQNGKKMTKLPTEVLRSEIILDNGQATTREIAKSVMRAKEILWNGPLGKFEEGFFDGTLEVARAIAKSRAHSTIGGGDSVSAIQKLKLIKNFNFISTGGGAMLDYLADGSLPGLDALKRRS